ncbi:MAG: acetate/propionate family kinase [Spirochaetales bacterium]|nr:acetate/propionate family kinase [Spirochaetales bacterium]
MDVISFLSSHVPLFKGFPETKIKELLAVSRVMPFEPNEAIIEYGEKGEFLGVLLSGEAFVSITTDSGDSVEVARIKPGEIFGEMSLMTGEKTIADVIGLTQCSALLIPQSYFAILIATSPEAIKYISRIISERLKTFPRVNEQEGISDVSAAAKAADPYSLKLKSKSPMKLLVLRSSPHFLKYNLFSTADETHNISGYIEHVNGGEAVHSILYHGRREEAACGKVDHTEAVRLVFKAIGEKLESLPEKERVVGACGHRVVHGGDALLNSVVIDDKVINEIQAASVLAPNHNPVNLACIREAIRLFPDIPHVAVFDTSFHHTLPPYAYLYGLPYGLYEEKRIRRYGFQGMFHGYTALKAAEFLKRPYNELEVISCHLGGSASVCAVDHGRSVDVSMGFTPQEGLLMDTRSGDIDPSILSHLIINEKMTPEQVRDLFEKEGGLKGLSGISDDMVEIENAANDGNSRAILTVKSYGYRVKKYIGSYMAAMGGLDVLAFSGGIGQGSAFIRSLACQGLACMGIVIDEAKNKKALDPDRIYDISGSASQVKILVMPAREEKMIARETLRVLGHDYVTKIIHSQEPMVIPLEVSAHHLHLSQDHVEALFGPGHQLTRLADLSQPGQFACEETVDLIGPKGLVKKVRVLGPARKETQVEIAMTEQYKLGVLPPIRQSGDLKGSPGITIQANGNTLTIDHGVICALRHIHMSTEEALKFGLHDRDVVRIRVQGDRELIFGDVLVRVNPNYRLAMHIDTDEANAANIKTGMIGYLDGIQSR